MATAAQGEAAPAATAMAAEPCVLINCFEVPEGAAEEVLAKWRAAQVFMAKQDGYISTKLHQSLDPKARFQFINVAQWQSPQHFQAVLNSHEFQTVYASSIPGTHIPALYRVVAE